LKRDNLYQAVDMADKHFPVIVKEYAYPDTNGIIFDNHWHEQIELLFCLEGKVVIRCGGKTFTAARKDLLIINSNEMHGAENHSGPLRYFCIIIDIALLRSSFFDVCDAKYLSPISNNYICFQNKIDSDPGISFHVQSIIDEYESRQTGFELAIKGHICSLFVILLRHYVARVMSPAEFARKVKNTARLDGVLKYIEQNFTGELPVTQLALMINVSPYRFCHLFRELTGMTLGQYKNRFRIAYAEKLLRTSEATVTEIAYASGFGDINYFSRVFREYRGMTPSDLRRQDQRSLYA